MSCFQLHHHEQPNESEAPMLAFQQNALLFLVHLGERPDVCPRPCMVERGRIVFVVGALSIVGCVRARALDGGRRPILGGTPRSGGRRRHGA